MGTVTVSATRTHIDPGAASIHFDSMMRFRLIAAYFNYINRVADALGVGKQG